MQYPGCLRAIACFGTDARQGCRLPWRADQEGENVERSLLVLFLLPRAIRFIPATLAGTTRGGGMIDNRAGWAG
eukprot:5119879-Pyramimonas_sp.AAC.1